MKELRRRFRWVGIVTAFLAAVSLSFGAADAAHKTKVDEATKRVERGAKQIGQGQVGPRYSPSRSLSARTRSRDTVRSVRCSSFSRATNRPPRSAWSSPTHARFTIVPR